MLSKMEARLWRDMGDQGTNHDNMHMQYTHHLMATHIHTPGKPSQLSSPAMLTDSHKWFSTFYMATIGLSSIIMFVNHVFFSHSCLYHSIASITTCLPT